MSNELIGNTPLVNIDGIWCKCEFMNLTGSIKDRIAYEMLSNIDISKYKHVLEVTSGNTGISVAAISSWLGFKATIVCPTFTSKMKQELISRYGASIININGNISDCMKFATKHHKHHYFLNQFNNEYNKKAQMKMALEVAIQLAQQSPRETADIIVTGIGTGGTLAGLYHRFPDAKFVTWDCTKLIEGTSDGVPLPLKPKKCDLTIFPIDYNEVLGCQKYLSEHGFFVGLSSAANFYVAKAYKLMHPNKTVVTILVDRGERYLE